jgi:UPF0716 protein FxsA
MARLLWILLLLPVLEVVTAVLLYNRLGTPFLAWLLAGALIGSMLLGVAKANLRAVLAQLGQGGSAVAGVSLWKLLVTARVFFAGLLFLVPGVLSDVLALVVLLLPGKLLAARAGVGPKAANDDVIEAEFHEVREERRRLPHDE